MEDNKANDLLKRLEAFKQSHLKLLLIERKKAILDLYKCLQKEVGAEAELELEDDEDSLLIVIKAKELTACDDAPALIKIIILANIVNVRNSNGFVVFNLWYRCWKWI